MNWRVSSLDRFRLVSNSDAHSPEKLGREVCVFDTELDYFALRKALETGHGYEGTMEFFPEEGKYHLDGHRNCNICFLPGETRQHEGRCPVCGKPLTVGVMHRIEDLADRAEVAPPETAGSMKSLVPLPEILSEIYQVGPKSKRISHHYETLLGQLGPELQLLNTLPLEDIEHATSSLLTEAVSRLRRQEVIREAGYDGVYGTIRMFQAAELRQHSGGASLFREEKAALPPVQRDLSRDLPRIAKQQAPDKSEAPAPPPQSPLAANPSADILAELDEDQRRAAEIITGPLLIVAGPGSGKNKNLNPPYRSSYYKPCCPSRSVFSYHLHQTGSGRDAESFADGVAKCVGTSPTVHLSLLRAFHPPGILECRRVAARFSGRNRC